MKKIIIAVCMLFCSSSLLAAAPQACPDVNAIKAQPMTRAFDNEDGTFTPYDVSFYGTNNEWAFALAIAENSPKAALESGNELLKSLRGHPHPMQDDDPDSYFCIYSTKSELAIAITPNPVGLKKYIG